MVRKWVGGGLKPLGEMLEREEETHEGERAAVLREIFMRSTREVRPPPPFPPLSRVKEVRPFRVVLSPSSGPETAVSRARRNAGRETRVARYLSRLSRQSRGHVRRWTSTPRRLILLKLVSSRTLYTHPLGTLIYCLDISRHRIQFHR